MIAVRTIYPKDYLRGTFGPSRKAGIDGIGVITGSRLRAIIFVYRPAVESSRYQCRRSIDMRAPIKVESIAILICLVPRRVWHILLPLQIRPNPYLSVDRTARVGRPVFYHGRNQLFLVAIGISPELQIIEGLFTRQNLVSR